MKLIVTSIKIIEIDMITKQKLIEGTCILIGKHNELIRELCPDEVEREINLSYQLDLLKSKKKAYIGEFNNSILQNINKLKEKKDGSRR